MKLAYPSWSCTIKIGFNFSQKNFVYTILLTYKYKHKQEAHGSHRSAEKPFLINKHIFLKLWLYHITWLRVRKNHLLLLELIEWSLFVKAWFLFSQKWFVQSLVEMCPVVLENILLNFINVFWLFRNYLPLEMGVALHLNKLEFPFSQGCFVPSLVEIGPVTLENKMKMWKITDRRSDHRSDGQRDDRRSKMLTWAEIASYLTCQNTCMTVFPKLW